MLGLFLKKVHFKQFQNFFSALKKTCYISLTENVILAFTDGKGKLGHTEKPDFHIQ